MRQEASITINSHELTEDQAWAVRQALQLLYEQACRVVAQSSDAPVAHKAMTNCIDVLACCGVEAHPAKSPASTAAG
jgi:hypothetical protein